MESPASKGQNVTALRQRKQLLWAMRFPIICRLVSRSQAPVPQPEALWSPQPCSAPRPTRPAFWLVRHLVSFLKKIPVNSRGFAYYCLMSGTAPAQKWAAEIRKKIMDTRTNAKLEDLIMRNLYSSPRHQAVLRSDIFDPPISSGDIWRIGCALAHKGYTTVPGREEVGWRLRLLGPGVDYVEN